MPEEPDTLIVELIRSQERVATNVGHVLASLTRVDARTEELTKRIDVIEDRFNNPDPTKHLTLEELGRVRRQAEHIKFFAIIILPAALTGVGAVAAAYLAHIWH